MKLGIQLYGCRDIFRADTEAFFRKAAAAGYTLIEPCIMFGSAYIPDPDCASPFWLPEELDIFLSQMKKYNLSIESFHAFGDLIANSDAVNAVIAKCQARYLMINGPADQHVQHFEEYVQMCNSIASSIMPSGAQLCIHNGPLEISEKVNGKSFLEAVLQECTENVGVQIDVGWVQYGGEDPLTYLQKVEPYLRSLHYKDLRDNYQNLPDFKIHICLGQGCVNTASIYRYAQDRQLAHIIDQDMSERNLMEDVVESAEFLYGLHYLHSIPE